MIEISVNNKLHYFAEQISLQQLLETMRIMHVQGVAIAVNDEVVPKVIWQRHTLNHTDKVLIIQASQGG